MICWFEDRANGSRIALEGFVERIGITRAADIQDSLARIEHAHASGHWVALVIEYEFGQWLEPSIREGESDHDGSQPADVNAERLTALVFKRSRTGSIAAMNDRAGTLKTPVATTAADQTTRASPVPGQIVRARTGIAETDYLGMVQEIRALIAAGEVYQINATFPIHVETFGSTLDLYNSLAATSQARHCAYIEDPQRGRTILSLSPELFVYREGNVLVTRPMKGTAPRVQGDVKADQAMGESLRNSSKDRAENLMIVDLLRNDLGRLAVTGSVTVDPLFELEAYPSVWTLTSTISAQLKPGCSLLETLQALFPCGSITGAPKIAAMRHIKRLERRDRGVYCGSVGWLAPDGRMSLNVAIRTLVIDRDGQGVYGVGGGIVYDSVPENEWQECFWKARILGVNCET